MDPLLIWRSIDENREEGYLVGEVKEKVRRIQETYRRTDLVEWILNNAGVSVSRPLHVEEAPEGFVAMLESLGNAKAIKIHLDTMKGQPWDLVPSMYVEKTFREWMREYIPSQANFIPARERFAEKLKSKGYLVIYRNARTYIVTVRNPECEELEDESPI